LVGIGVLSESWSSQGACVGPFNFVSNDLYAEQQDIWYWESSFSSSYLNCGAISVCHCQYGVEGHEVQALDPPHWGEAQFLTVHCLHLEQCPMDCVSRCQCGIYHSEWQE
jgi:hypothetical protein